MGVLPSIPNIPGLPPGVQKLSDEISSYNRYVNIAKAKAQSKAVGATAAAADPAAGAVGANTPVSITLELQGISAPAKTTQPIVPRSPGSPGRPPQPGKTQMVPQVAGTLSFTASPDSDGFVQRIGAGFAARQTTHQTAGGYYVDEFGLAPGTLSVEIIVVTKGDLVDRINAFKSLLYDAKLASPLSPDFPKILKYTNAYDGTSYILTQTRLDVQNVADRPNTLSVTISGEILSDYSGSKASGVSGQISVATTGTQALVLAQEESIRNYIVDNQA